MKVNDTANNNKYFAWNVCYCLYCDHGKHNRLKFLFTNDILQRLFKDTAQCGLFFAVYTVKYLEIIFNFAAFDSDEETKFGS